MASVVGIGAAVFDILMTVDAFPREDTKLRGLETKFQCGGPCATGGHQQAGGVRKLYGHRGR